MFFFKQRMSIPDYCSPAFGLLFSYEQARYWISFKAQSNDRLLQGAEDDVFISNMCAANIQLLSVAINKTCKNIVLASELYGFIDAYLAKHGLSSLRPLKDTYNSAFGSSRVDGVLAMAQLLSHRVSANGLSQDSVLQIRNDMYSSLAKYYISLKKIKLIVS